MNNKLIFLVLLFPILFTCCVNTIADNEDLISDTTISTERVEISKESMTELISNVSSPIEIASLLLNENVAFNKSYIANTNNVDNLISDFDCAINIGILGADLGYLNIYEKTSSVMSTVAGINKLSNKLKVGQFFNFSLLKRLATSSKTLDSLIYTSVSSFNNMEAYLRQNDRTNISALMVTGVWVESTSLATMVYKDKPNEKIGERIGEQKLILNNLVIIIDNYRSDSRFAELAIDLHELKTIFNEIEITTVEGEPETVVENGMLVIHQTSESTVHITDDQIELIAEKVSILREKLINNNLSS